MKPLAQMMLKTTFSIAPRTHAEPARRDQAGDGEEPGGSLRVLWYVLSPRVGRKRRKLSCSWPLALNRHATELDDRPTKRESKKKGTTRQRLNKIVNKRTGGREARE
jgi:hypothetical protein